MKKIFSILSTLLALTLSLALGACQSDKYQEPEDSFKVITSEISESKEASVGNIQLSEGGFQYQASAPWVSLKLKDATNLELSISENTSGEMRTCLITLSKGTTRINVPVHQMGRISEVKELRNFTVAIVGGEQSFTFVSENPIEVTYSEDGWLNHRIEGGKLIFTALRSNVAHRTNRVRVQTGLYVREITVTQRMTADDLLGEYTLSYMPSKDAPRREVDARLEKKDNSYFLIGAAAPIPVTINPTTFAIKPTFGNLPNTPEVPAGQQLVLAAWAAAYPKADGQANYSLWWGGDEAEYIGTWDKNTDMPKFTFKSAKADGQARSIIFFRSPNFQGWYEGGNKINALIDPILTKKKSN